MPSIKRVFVGRSRDQMQLKEFFKKNLEGVGFSDLDIQKSPLGTRVTIKAARPGLVIGKKGSNVKRLTEILSRDFKLENPNIDVDEVKNPELDAQIMAERLASALEKGQHYRRSGYGLLRRIIRAGAEGCEIVISGKITSQRGRYQKMRQGIIKRCGEPVRDISYGIAHAKLKAGILGIRIKILPPDYNNPKEISYRGKDGLDSEYKDRIEAYEEVVDVEMAAGEPLPGEVADDEIKALAEKAAQRIKIKGKALAGDDDLEDDAIVDDGLDEADEELVEDDDKSDDV